ncbi:MAG: ATP-binding protein [Geobacteraceae bacterium]|nr:ATP-binding protein [Geobacteraceae bacterium]
MNLSIKTKVLFITAGIVFISVGAIILTSAYVFTKEYTESLKSQSLAVGKGLKLQLDRLIHLGIGLENLTGFDEQCREAVSKNEGIKYAMVTDLDGRVLFHNDPSQQGKQLSNATIVQALKSPGEVVTVSTEDDVKNYDAIVPVFGTNGEHIGAVRIGFPAILIERKARGMALYAAGAGLPFLGAAMVSLLLALGAFVTRPLAKLLTGIEEIREKGAICPVRVAIDSGDELGRLASAFNGMAEELREATFSVNELVEERTRQLREAQEELVHKEKLAMLGLIAGGMGNELRNPLGVMNNAIFYLKTVMTDADETVKEYLEIIRQEIDNSQGIISDLLDFCRVRTAITRAAPVHELINQSLARCVIPENVRLRADLPEIPLVARIDPHQMVQVLRNLLTNALQAMPDGGALHVAARRVRGPMFDVRGSEQNVERRTPNVEPDAEFVEISVADTGVGIPPENMERIFQPLFTTRSRGIGLGLAYSKKLAEANGGRIEVASRLGEGTTFTVMLPVENGEG